ncbi:MAG: helix-turn-helix domain-containing protein [Bacteroidetes bacterium]|nr:helix-turn-helix transcriptional regulator [Bacteroidales bacterium]MBU1010963.1 helix-turn-helix domain-containing protein [Bacteroidota bacterium]
MKDRIAKILQIKNLTATRFAEELDIQRSGISHILSGRNNPSLDLIMKIKETYPEFSLDWLIMGKGPMTDVSGQKASKPGLTPDLFDQMPEKAPETDQSVEPNVQAGGRHKEISTVVLTDEAIKSKTLTEDSDRVKHQQHVERIVFFYTDNTFKVYRNEAP